MTRLWVIAYDIEDDATRRRVHDILKNHGRRVQYSVFECWLQGESLQRLRHRLQAELDAGDGLRWYPLCEWCRERVEWQGDGSRTQDEAFYLL